jgi:uncharacterized membrane protein YeiH
MSSLPVRKSEPELPWQAFTNGGFSLNYEMQSRTSKTIHDTFGILGYRAVRYRKCAMLTILDLIAATTNAFNGALLARRPDHYRHFTVAGIIILALFGGIGGGVLRDVLLNVIPAPIADPRYLVLAIAAAALALAIDYNTGQRFRGGMFAFMTAFSLPWYAVVGAQKATDFHLGVVAAVLIAVIGTTGGRFIIDIACGLPPKQLVRGEFFVLNPALTATLYLACRDLAHLSLVPATAIAVVFGFGFRILAQVYGWEELEPRQPAQERAGEKQRGTLVESIGEEISIDASEPVQRP